MKFLKFRTLLVALCCCSTINAAARQDGALPRFVTLTWKLSLDPSGNITRLELPDDEMGSALYDKMEPVVRGWHFTPGKLDGQPAPTNTALTVVVTFEPSESDGYRVRILSAKTGGAPKHLVAPRYPVEAIRMRRDGLVLLKIDHDVDGHIVSISRIAHKEGDWVDQKLVNASLAAAKQWAFDPETVGGHPVAGSVVMPFCFTLEGRKDPCVFNPGDGQEPFETPRPISQTSVVAIDTGSSIAHTP
jgi:TonB family protein